jgi:hypothetical protein
MSLILRMACSRADPQRAEEARRLLKTTPVHSFSLLQRIALSSGDTQRAEAAQELLKTMREPSTKPGHTLALIKRIALAPHHTDYDVKRIMPRRAEGSLSKSL